MTRPRLAAAALALGLVAVASYALQRLASAWFWKDPAGVVAQVHIPYYWRCAVALLHGLVAACLAGFGLDEVQARAVLERGAALVTLIVLPSAVAMVLVP